MTTTPKYSFLINKGTKKQVTNAQMIERVEDIIKDIKGDSVTLSQVQKQNIDGLNLVIHSLATSKTINEHYFNMSFLNQNKK
jgi:hypothetical protein